MEVEDENVYSEETLGNCSYRMLQKISKSMHLPSNVKRVYLIELILTKQNCSEEELDDLIKVIKAARKESPKKKKKDLKKISEKTDVQDKCPSPMITSTPKRKTPKQPFCLKDHETINEYKQKAPNQTNTLSRQILSPMTSNNESHRILRSSHLKKPSKIVHSNDYFDSTDTGNTLKEKDVHHKENVKSKINEMKINPKSLLKSPKNNQVVYMPRHDKKQVIHTIEINKLNPPIMTPKTLNLVYPLWPDPKSFRSNVSVKILNVKQSNGKVSKIRALVRKREIINAQRFNDKNRDLNTEPVMEVHLPNDDNYLNGNPLYVDDNVIEECNKEPKQYNFVNADFLYYNDIHGDLACCKEVSTREFVSDPTFPSNDEAFNTTENRDVTQPLHIETSDYWRKSNDFISTNTDQDKLFIANSQYDIYEPLLKIATETDSYSSYSISESSSIMVDQPSDLVIDQYITPVGTDLLNDINDVIYNEEKDNTESELFKFSQIVNSFLIQQEGKDFVDTNTSISLSDTSQETGGDITIHDMVDDAIEIINNDGACSDGVGNDIGVQCIFCSWAGPQDLLESHVKDEHSNMINESLNNECIIQYNLGYLMQSQLWLSEVIEHASVLYAVCIKYEDPDSLMATIAILTSNPVRGHKGAITVYNKVTGEPYMWEGMIQPLSPNMPHFNDLDGLNIGLSTLNLIPNSANLKLVNRELVNDTTSKVVVGQPELDGIHIELLISIL